MDIKISKVLYYAGSMLIFFRQPIIGVRYNGFHRNLVQDGECTKHSRRSELTFVTGPFFSRNSLVLLAASETYTFISK